MSSRIEYLIQLHCNGVISDDDLRKGIRALNVPEGSPPVPPAPLAAPAPPASPPSEKRANRNKKKKEKRQKQKYAHFEKSRRR